MIVKPYRFILLSLLWAFTSSLSTMTTNMWFQHEISITAPSRGCHLITSDVEKAIHSDLSQIKIGMCNLFIQHTSASLTINENADPDVRRDMEVALNKIGTFCLVSVCSSPFHIMRFADNYLQSLLNGIVMEHFVTHSRVMMICQGT
jgi:hypothetical protein